MALFRHTNIRHLELGRFKFENYEMRIDDEDADEFRALAALMPAAYRSGIVEIDESVVAVKPLQSPTAKEIVTSDVLKIQQVEQPVTGEPLPVTNGPNQVTSVITTKDVKGATVAERVAAAKKN